MRADDWDLEGLVALADQLGRKLEVDDVTPGMRKLATEWLRKQETVTCRSCSTCSGSWTASRGKLSLGQAKGVLNCAIADTRRRPKAAAKGQAEPVELEAGSTSRMAWSTRCRRPSTVPVTPTRSSVATRASPRLGSSTRRARSAT